MHIRIIPTILAVLLGLVLVALAVGGTVWLWNNAITPMWAQAIRPGPTTPGTPGNPPNTTTPGVPTNPPPSGISVLPPGLTQARGECEGLNDYQVKDLTEFSASPGYFLHVQYWRIGVDNFEKETLLPSGRYAVKLPNLHGHVWELGPSCTAEQALQKHVGPSIQRRLQLLAPNQGYVHWEQLVRDGFISVVAQHQPVPGVPGSLTAVTSGTGASGTLTGVTSGTITSPASCGDGVREDFDPRPNVVWTPRGEDGWRAVNFWSNWTNPNFSSVKVLMPPGQRASLKGGGDAHYWPKECEEAAKAGFAKSRYSEVSLGTLAGQGWIQ